MLQFDDLFGQHLEHIAEHLDASPLSYAVRTQSALEETAHLAFHINKENGKYGVQSHNAHPDNDTFYEYSQSLGMTEVNVWCIQLVIILKSNIYYIYD